MLPIAMFESRDSQKLNGCVVQSDVGVNFCATEAIENSALN